MMAMVGRARMRINFLPPDLYHPKDKHFNCVQRVHQNTLELLPQFVVLLLLGLSLIHI